MKKVQLVAYENIHGVAFEDLDKLNASFCSNVEVFDDLETNEHILDILETKYKANISKLYNPVFKLNFIKETEEGK